jgi:hypothetical protein
MLKTLAIHYCLKSPGGNYDVLGKYIKGFDGWAHVHESLWFARTHKSVTIVRDELSQLVRNGDHVIVLDVTGDSWATNFAGKAVEWMEKEMGTVRVAA